MATTRKSRNAAAPEKSLRVRQRQKLIDACISALHLYGPSSTTVDKVVTIADMSPGIVNFYFETKAAMLVAALEYLAVEFEREVVAPVTALSHDPARALALLIDLYLDSELASPRKVSVWYAFWGEANSRQEYHDICGNKDETFANLVQDLIARLIAETGQHNLDPDAIALGLIGALEILWQNIAFQEEAQVDRVGGKRRCHAYLRSVFPGYFSGEAFPAATVPTLVADRRPPADQAFARERDLVLFPAWHLVGHENDMPRTGDYLTLELAGERILVVRGEDGVPRAVRNACSATPHALCDGPAGNFPDKIVCRMDGHTYGYDGTAQSPGRGLTPLQVARVAGLIFVRLFGDDRTPAPDLAERIGDSFMGLDLLEPPALTEVAANWKTVVENWLDGLFTLGTLETHAQGLEWRRPDDGNNTVRLDIQAGDTPGMLRLFLFPDLLIETGRNQVSVWQVLAVDADRSRIRRLNYRGPGETLTRIRQELDQKRMARTIAACESTQAGMAAPLYSALDAPSSDGPARYFRDWLAGRLPLDRTAG